MFHSKFILCFLFLYTCLSIPAFARGSQQNIHPTDEFGSRIVKNGCKVYVSANALQAIASANDTLKVTLKYKANEKGEITDIGTLKSSGKQLLDNAARMAMSTCTLEPATRNEQLKSVWYKTQMEFTSEEKSGALIAVGNIAQPISIHPGIINMAAAGCAPDYPKEALKTNLQGTVKFSAHIDATGMVSKVNIIESSKSQLLDDAISNRLMEGRCRTVPGTFDGSPVATITIIQYVFRLE